MVYHSAAPIIAMPPVASTPPTPTSLHRHASHEAAHQQQHQQQQNDAASSSASSSLSAGSSHMPSHQIPFHATPVNHGPTPLSFGFGFGFGSSSGSHAQTQSQQSQPQPHSHTSMAAMQQQWGQPPLSPASAARFSNASSSSSSTSAANSTNNTSRRSDAKRRRGDEDDEDDGYGGGGAGDSDSEMDTSAAVTPLASMSRREKSGSPQSARPISSSSSSRQTLPKRMRAGLGGFGSGGGSGGGGVATMNMEDGSSRQQSAAHSSSSLASSHSPSSSSSKQGSSRPASLADRVDLGRILATLDKPSLLSLFHKMLATSSDPSLRDQIVSLLPSPSLDSIESALDEVEKAIRAALPSGGSQEVRAEFAWGRLRSPVAEFVHTAQGFLPLFVDEDTRSTPTSSSSTFSSTEASSKREQPHVSTTFNFLHLVTVRALRVLEALPAVPRTASMFALDRQQPGPLFRSMSHNEAVKALGQMLPAHSVAISSPNSIVNQLLPLLAVQWTRLFERVARAVNEEGKMFGAEMVRGWIASLNSIVNVSHSQQSQQQDSTDSGDGSSDASCEEPAKAMRMALHALQDRFEQEIGWLIGVHKNSFASSIGFATPQHSSQHHQQQPQQHLYSRPMDQEEEL